MVIYVPDKIRAHTAAIHAAQQWPCMHVFIGTVGSENLCKAILRYMHALWQPGAYAYSQWAL